MNATFGLGRDAPDSPLVMSSLDFVSRASDSFLLTNETDYVQWCPNLSWVQLPSSTTALLEVGVMMNHPCVARGDLFFGIPLLLNFFVK
ncbi:hypothetical protein V6N13_032561 [Hibiscus sabdariffa]